ncbi:hypothetical protein, partial [Brevundimonas sp.]|uniref:hypothetical protein n=1 Tax=Brevundimonas sp. TaxID=1871086 RepID=UPI0012283401
MLSLTNRASITSALSDPDLDLDLRVLIGLRARLVDDDTKLFVVQAGDTPDVINEALAFAITGDQAEEPSFKWVLDHGRWFEILYDRGGERSRILVENHPGTELGIHYLCLSHFCRGGHQAGRLVTSALVSDGLRDRTACDAGWAPQAPVITQP